MIDADKGQGKIQDGYTCQKQVKTVQFLEFVVSIFFFLERKIIILKINKRHTQHVTKNLDWQNSATNERHTNTEMVHWLFRIKNKEHEVK